MIFKKNIYNFDIKKIDFKKNLKENLKIKNFDSFIQNTNNADIYEQFYKIVNNKSFNKIYFKLLTEIKKKLKLNNFYFQRIPSFRIQKKGLKSVNFHNDIWYGHGANVVNIWVPLTNTNKHNSLLLVDDDKTNLIDKKFKKNKLSLFEVNNLALKYSQPVIIKYGQFLHFNTSQFHGTSSNLSDENRVSFDFRILKINDDPGTKSYDEFYSLYKNTKTIKKQNAISFMYKQNFILSNLSHSIQREIIKSYCNSNNIEISQEETEIYGVNHYPNINYYIDNKKYKHFVLISILFLPQNKELRKILMRKIKENNLVIHFALENISTASENLTKIENHYVKLTRTLKSVSCD